MISVRLATGEDLEGLMLVEHEAFDPMDAAVSAEVMADRIARFNRVCETPGWLWLAEVDSEIGGYVLLQPTAMAPGACTSWDHATDEGRLERTYKENGSYLYVVSLGTRNDCLPATSDFLAHITFIRWQAAGSKSLSFCMRMPGFAEANGKTQITPEDYVAQRRPDGGPCDYLLHEYWDVTGRTATMRLLRDGYPPDAESGGHGVLFTVTDPLPALLSAGRRIYRGGVLTGRKQRK